VTKSGTRWVAKINGRTLGYFRSETQAALRYDEQAAEFGKPLHFPVQNGQRLAIKSARAATSNYKGVYWKKDVKKWVAFATIEGKTAYIDSFDSEVEAAVAHDNYVSPYGGVVNEPDTDEESGECEPKPPSPTSEKFPSSNLLEVASSLLSLQQTSALDQPHWCLPPSSS